MEIQGLYHRFVKSFRPFAYGACHLFWPGQCHVCQNSIGSDDNGLCSACWQDLSKAVAADYCRRCGRDVSPFGVIDGYCGNCRDNKPLFDGILRVGHYESALRALILSFKFSEKTELLPRLAEMLKQVVFAGSFYGDIEIIVPVPLHWRRRIRRGFNQSYLLARSLNLRGVGISTDLVRVRNTQQQWDLTAAQRRRNVKGAFAVRKRHPFSKKTILLVDDITTSCATLNECAKTLKQAGAVKVYTAVLATAFHDD